MQIKFLLLVFVMEPQLSFNYRCTMSVCNSDAYVITMRLFEMRFSAAERFNLAVQTVSKGSRVMVLIKASGQ